MEIVAAAVAIILALVIVDAHADHRATRKAMNSTAKLIAEHQALETSLRGQIDAYENLIAAQGRQLEAQQGLLNAMRHNMEAQAELAEERGKMLNTLQPR